MVSNGAAGAVEADGEWNGGVYYSEVELVELEERAGRDNGGTSGGWGPSSFALSHALRNISHTEGAADGKVRAARRPPPGRRSALPPRC